MNKSIWKFPLEYTDLQIISVPKNSKPIAVGEQNGTIMMWMEVDVSKEKKDMKVLVVGTGYEYDSSGLKFIGTTIMSNGLVWHVFAEVGVEE